MYVCDVESYSVLDISSSAKLTKRIEVQYVSVCAYLRVIEERLTVVDASSDTMRQRPLSVEQQLVPRLLSAQRRRVHRRTDRQTHEVPTEVIERHPSRHSHRHYKSTTSI